MDTNTLLIIVLVVLVLGGGGFFFSRRVKSERRFARRDHSSPYALQRYDGLSPAFDARRSGRRVTECGSASSCRLPQLSAAARVSRTVEISTKRPCGNRILLWP